MPQTDYTTLEQYWTDFVKNSVKGYNSKRLKDLRYTFFSGAIAYRNIIAKFNMGEDNKKTREEGVKLLLDMEKELLKM